MLIFWFQFIKGIIKRISYERRDYESVDEKNLSSVMSRKRRKNSSGSKRLKKVMISEKFPIIAASMSRETKRAFLMLSQKSMENRVRAVKGLL